MPYQSTVPGGLMELKPTQVLAPRPRDTSGLVRATGGHNTWKLDAPQSVAGLRDQFELARPGTTFDLTGQLFHIRGQQLVIHDNTVGIVGGVFVIEPTKDARAGLLPRDRKNDLTFKDTVFILKGTDTEHMEALLYAYACEGKLILEGCLFAGEPNYPGAWNTRVAGNYKVPEGRSRCVSVKASGTAGSGGLEARCCTFIMADERNQPTGGAGISCVEVAGTLLSNQRTHYQANKVPVGVRTWAKGAYLKDCFIQGGYYGVNLAAVDGFRVEGCVVTGNTRGISMQDSTTNGEIVGNQIVDFKSSGVHTAYGTATVDVVGNHLYSAVAEGQGCLQAYCGTRDIAFLGNTVTLAVGTTAQAHVYIGNDAQSTEVRGNMLTGPYRVANIAVDQSWTKVGDKQSTYGKRYAADEVLGVSAEMRGTELLGNKSCGRMTLSVTATNGALSLMTDDMDADIGGVQRRIEGLTVV
jgi:parallel beta-helix repeat protein